LSQVLIALNSFKNHITRLDRSRQRADALFIKKAVVTREYDLLYESTFLSAVTHFEDLLERFLVHMIYARKGPTKSCTSMISATSRDVVRMLILQGEEYPQLLPLERTIKLAKTFLTAPVPFDIQDQGARSLLAQSVKIRNAIAHQSPFALKTFRTKVSGVEDLPPNRRYPGPFLRQVFRASPAQTRHELYTSALKNVAEAVASAW
jgi:hypothetical protein